MNMKKFYKGFNEDLTCRGFQYEEGKTYTEDKADLCHRGFHACEDPLDCFSYYEPRCSQFREVLLEGISDQREDDSKVCAKTITIGARLSFSDMVKAAFDFRWSKTTLEPGSSATGTRGAASATGTRGAASATGYRGAASATGYQGAASATGYYGAASATGYQGAASATGDYGAASATGKDSIAAAFGKSGKAKASLGNWIVLTERGDRNGESYPIIAVKAFEVDGKDILPDTWYTLINGKPEKAE